MTKLSGKKNLSRIINALLFTLAITFAIYTIYANSSELAGFSFHVNIPLLGLSFLIECFGMFIAVLIWRRLIGTLGISHSLPIDIRIYSYSTLALLIPGGFWSIISRSSLYQNLGTRSYKAAIASIMENLLIGTAGLGVYTIATLARPELSPGNKPWMNLILLVALLVLIHPWTFNRLMRWSIQRFKISDQEPISIDLRARDLSLWISIEMVVIIIGGIAVFTLLASITSVSLEYLFLMIIIWAIATTTGGLLFWLPGTLFYRDGAIVLMLASSVALPLALAFVIILRLWSIASIILLAGIIWITMDLPLIIKNRT
jgi:hypothetical protein